ncbi:hypothetical protein [Breoghania sp.]|uniref:hypothetical protein n=1 Tax=Breoghania sp. TaxID=2065378 RepID=UPI002623C378|nr:hypothetical protein [Breoghania sp.]MDJ0930361.1 hypothetical protein [Breoghania sp.]
MEALSRPLLRWILDLAMQLALQTVRNDEQAVSCKHTRLMCEQNPVFACGYNSASHSLIPDK